MKQEGGDKSLNVQAGRDVVVGVSYAEARQIALDVYKANATQLADTAKQVAIQRAEEMTDRFLGELNDRNPSAISQASRPDFQMALLDAQKAYARTGDKELAKVLADLLVNRTQQDPRSLREIVLTESLHVVPKLTVDQINTISLIFLFRYSQHPSIVDFARLGLWYNKYIAPLQPSLRKSESLYRHLEYSGTATPQQFAHITIATVFKKTYPGLFSKGFDESAIVELTSKHPELKKLLLEAPNPGKKMLPSVTRPTFDDLLRRIGVVDEAEQERLWTHQGSDMPNDDEILAQINRACPGLGELAAVWDSSSASRMMLTSVGIAVGHANFQRVTGDSAPLSVWIPE